MGTTQPVELEEKYRVFFESIDNASCIMRLQPDAMTCVIELVFDQVNAAFESQTGVLRAVGRTLSDVLPALNESWISICSRVRQTGRSERSESYLPGLDRWFRVRHSRLGGEGSDLVAVLLDELTPSETASDHPTASEFLARLSDSLRALSDPITIQGEAASILGRNLKVQRVAYARVEGADEVIDRDWTDGVPSAVGRRVLSSCEPTILRALLLGTTVSSSDVKADAGLGAAHLASCAAMETRAYVYVPLLKEGKLLAVLAVSTIEPRMWASGEIVRIEAAAKRICAAVQRASAEAVLRDSEKRFRQFAQASSGVLAIRKATTLSLDYVSPACSTVYQVAEDAILGDVERWAALIAPEDRATALEHLRAARNGPVIRELRVDRPDGSRFWIRHTAFPLFDEEGRVQRIGSIAEDVTKAKIAAENQSILVGELQHRVRNVMAVVRSMTAATGAQAQDVAEFGSLLTGRLLALARVQKLLTGAANAGVTVRRLVSEELSAQVHRPDQFELSGADCTIPPHATEVLALVVHELTETALKDGALSVPGGRLAVRWWNVKDGATHWLSFDWAESNVPDASDEASRLRRYAFLNELIEEQIPYELDGLGSLVIEAGAVRCHIEFPLRDAASILETDVPARVLVQ